MLLIRCAAKPSLDGRFRYGRIIFVNRYFYPDHSSTSQILSDLAFHLAASGRDVRVITSQQRYDDPTAHLPPQETVGSVEIRRVATTRFGRSALLGRGIDYLSFYASARHALRASIAAGDIVVAKTDPPLLSILARQTTTRRGAHLINWLQDLYPEVAIELGVPLLNGSIGAAISHLRDRSLKAAVTNVVVGEIMAERVRSRGISPDRVCVIPNWNDDEDVRPVSHDDNPMRRRWGLADKFVVGYSGNLGRAHEFETVLAASEQLRDRSDIVFLFVGGGHLVEELARRVRERRLECGYRFLPYQDRAELGAALCVPDIHWVSLLPAMEGLIVPSKFYGIVSAGRPVIAITARNGEIARLVREHECGVVVDIGDADELANTIKLLAGDRERVAGMGRRARAMLDAHFSRQRAFDRWHTLLDAVERLHDQPGEAGDRLKR